MNDADKKALPSPAQTEVSVLKKSNDLIVMAPAMRELTPLSRKIYNVLLKETQQQWSEVVDRTNKRPDATHHFTAVLSSLLKKAASSEESAAGMYKRGRACLEEMIDTKVSWKPVEKNIKNPWGSMHLLSQVKVYSENSITYVQWALPPDIMLHLIDQQSRFTLLNLSQLAKLKSYSALALYEIASSYRNLGSTSAHPTNWWISALLPGVTHKREWRNIKYEQVVGAVKEINEMTDLTIEGPIEKREAGLRSPVIGVHFNVRVKPKQAIESTPAAKPSDVKITPETVLLATQQKVSSRSMKNILEEFPAKGPVIIQAALTKMAAQSVESPDPYFLKTARNIGENDPSHTEPARPVPQPGLHEVEEDPVLVAARERMLSLPAKELIALGQRAFDSLSPGLVTQQLIKKWDNFEAGKEPMPPLIRAHALKIFQQEIEPPP